MVFLSPITDTMTGLAIDLPRPLQTDSGECVGVNKLCYPHQELMSHERGGEGIFAAPPLPHLASYSHLRVALYLKLSQPPFTIPHSPSQCICPPIIEVTTDLQRNKARATLKPEDDDKYWPWCLVTTQRGQGTPPGARGQCHELAVVTRGPGGPPPLTIVRCYPYIL